MWCLFGIQIMQYHPKKNKNRLLREPFLGVKMKILKTIKESWKIAYNKVKHVYETSNDSWARRFREESQYEDRDNIIFEDILQFDRWGYSAKAVLKTSTGEEVTMSNTEFKRVVEQARPKIQGTFTFKNVGGQIFLKRMTDGEIRKALDRD